MKRFLATVLAAGMTLSLLAGCQNAENTNQTPESREYAALSEELNLEYNEFDKDYYQSIIGKNPTDVAYTINDKYNVDMALYSYWLSYYLNYFLEYGGVDNMDWDTEWDESMTVGEAMMAYAMDSASYYAIIHQIAEDYGVALTEEDMEQCRIDRNELIRNYGQALWDTGINSETISADDFTEEEKTEWVWEMGSKAYQKTIEAAGTTDTAYANILVTTKLYEKVKDALYQDGGEKAPTEEQLETFRTENHMVPVKFIYMAVYDENYDEVDHAEEMEQLLKDIQEADDPNAKFEEAMAEVSEADFSKFENGYLASIADYDVEVLTKLEGLKDGEILGEVVKDDYGWYIFQKQPSDPEALINSYAEKDFNNVLDEYMADMDVKTNISYENFDLDAYTTKLAEYKANLELSSPEKTPAVDTPSDVTDSEEPVAPTEKPTEEDDKEGTEQTEASAESTPEVDDEVKLPQVEKGEEVDKEFEATPEIQYDITVEE